MEDAENGDMPNSSEDRIRAHPDEVLLQMTARKSVEAYVALYDRHAQVMYSLIIRIVQRTDAADEILQDAFWHVWERSGQYRGAGAAAAWMYRVARNRALDYMRREKAHAAAAQAPEKDVATGNPPQPRAETEIETGTRRRQILDALAAMPQEQRECLELAYFAGKSQRMIAAETRTTVDVVKSRMRIGLESLERLVSSTSHREGAPL